MLSRWRLLALALGSMAASALLLHFGVDESGRDGLFMGLWRTRIFLPAVLLLAAGFGFLAVAYSRRAVLQLAFAALLGLLTLGLFEVAGLLGLVSYPELLGNRRSVPTNDLASKRTPNLDVTGETFQDVFFSWGVPHEPIAFHYRTDAFGFRNDRSGLDAEVFVLGDSIVVGALVSEQTLLSTRLEEATGRPVMNVALVGISVQEEQALFRELGATLEGKTVLQFVFEGNDLLDSRAFRRREGSPESKAASEAAAEGFFDRSFSWNLLALLQRVSAPKRRVADHLKCEIEGRSIAFGWDARSFEGLADEIPILLTALSDFSREVTSKGGRFAVVFVPTKLRVLGPHCDSGGVSARTLARHLGPLRAALGDDRQAAGLRVIDLTEPLSAAARAGEIPWFEGDTHWNAIGHRVAAHAIAAALAADSDER